MIHTNMVVLLKAANNQIYGQIIPIFVFIYCRILSLDPTN